MRVVCTLPNASHRINGVKFEALGDGGGMLSEDIPEHIAEGFLGIRGYAVHEPEPKAEPEDDGAWSDKAGPKAEKKQRAAPAT